MSWGVFDSGVGGLTVVRALEKALPDAPLVYLGDTARVPYGIRSRQTVREYTRQAAVFLQKARVEGIIVACNTASSVALEVVGEVFDGPVLGMVDPGVRGAASVTRSRRVGVIGTQATVRSDAYGTGLRQLLEGVEVVSMACPLFVPLAEEGWVEGQVPELVAERYLACLREAAIDTLVLGCTHYPLLKGVIARVMGPQVHLVDSAEVAAAEAVHLQGEAGWKGAGGRGGAEGNRYCVTDAGGRFAEVAVRFLGHALPTLETVHL